MMDAMDQMDGKRPKQAPQHAGSGGHAGSGRRLSSPAPGPHPFSFPVAAALLLLSSIAPADRITLANGTVIDGRVVSQDKTHISIESRGMVLKLGLASVKSVEAVDSFENTLIASETAFKRSDPSKAIELLMNARRQGAPKERCAELVDRYQGRVSTAIQGATDQRQRASIRLALHELLKSDFLTPNTL